MLKKKLMRLICMCLVATTLSGCAHAASISEDMIPTVTNLGMDKAIAEEKSQPVLLSMNPEYMEESVRKDSDNTQKAIVKTKSVQTLLKATSIDKDLKIKIVNQKNGKVITGTKFEVSVVDENKKTTKYTDDDKDGIIYIKSMEAGKVKVSMVGNEQYTAPESITAEVKGKIEYKAVDITDEIKKESEINVAKEDSNPSGNDSAGTAEKLKDTVEYVPSTKTEPEKPKKTQKVDKWGQLVYSKQKTDKYGTPMYSVILSEPAADHVDDNRDNKCDRCGADLTPAHTHAYTEKKITKEATCTETGEYVMVCPTDNARGETGTIDALGHTEANENGQCTRCGAKIKEISSEPIQSEDVTADPKTVQDASELPTASIVVKGIMCLKTAPTEKIVYDTNSAPIYDTSSDPVYVEDNTSSNNNATTEIKYTGWQTIDGKTYYFDQNGNKVTGTQVIQGIQYTFDSNGVRTGTIGIDVSKYQKNINWKKVKNAGIDFVMIRCGYRGYGSGVLVQDPMFASHISGAKAAGLRVGVYFFSQAVTEAEAIEEASMAVKLAKQYGINMPIAIDSEYANGGRGRADGLSKSDRTKITIAFCNTVANSGYTPMIYASKSWFSSHLNVSSFPASYRIWVAHYAEKCGYNGRYDIWQNTSKGSVDGIPGNVDMNISSI